MVISTSTVGSPRSLLPAVLLVFDNSSYTLAMRSLLHQGVKGDSLEGPSPNATTSAYVDWGRRHGGCSMCLLVKEIGPNKED